MPCYSISIAEAVARKQAIKWYTGLLMKPYLPWSFDQNATLPNGLAAPGEDSASFSIGSVSSHRPNQICNSMSAGMCTSDMPEVALPEHDPRFSVLLGVCACHCTDLAES